MRNDTLLIFAAAPRLGVVKRRLARGIGPVAALRFHRAQLAQMARGPGRDRRWRTILALAPIGGGGLPGWLLRGFPRRGAQGPGDLGQRLARCTARHPGRVVVIGSDIPGITADDIAAAFRALGRADAVFGPAEDGGFWLAGLAPRRPARPFGAVRWDSEHALADTLANFAGRRIALLRTLRDIDTAEDLLALRQDRRAWTGLRRLRARPAPPRRAERKRKR
ncbi:DUF2064 domain-containing protein [Pseudoroseomonas cervicalis]|uniref:TIGR04282 family arsenosugar biosynthesis glycosyltransferase n=1 Tax=Teichococcus cervicalis TaxID=204525 RepID=UPI00277F42D3|nr:TIGR04282 family arsenosugar biosynthesis glycosyltransferase [Pseudoroseomonas cervicalis]MDQ1080582.1 rSAM/selenodomain-associated transferase 1 [Pseudoroseomonas cervicalis]